MTQRKLTNEQRTAACLMHMAAAFGFSAMPIDPDTWWTHYCAIRMESADSDFERAVWWALRDEHEDPDDDWLGYVEYVWNHPGGWAR
jgi:hypothetical protein